jgi:glycosyltransferase involved in cell wall biosynthesis
LTIVICSDFGAINGGQAKVAIESAIGLKKQGHRPIYFSATGPIDGSLAAAGVETVCLDQYDLVRNPSLLAGAVQGAWNATSAAALQACLEALPRGRTIVHVHGWAKALSPSIAKPIKASGLPAVYTMHEYYLFCPNGGFYNYRAGQACHLTPLSASCWLTHCDTYTYAHKLWRNARLSFARQVAGLPNVFSDFISISDFQRDIVMPFIPPGASLHRLSNPIGIADLGPRPAPDDGAFVFVGRISAEKGPLLFAEAARRIGRVPVFVGDGPLAATVADQYPEAKLVGWQAPEAVHHIMRTARALVFPSVWYEGQPLTVLEAKALGVPVIVSDGCAGRDAVSDGVTGLWFKNGDVEDLTRALRALESDERCAQFSQAAHRSYWSDPPTLERHVAGLTAIYQTMLGRRHGEVTLPSAAVVPSDAPAALTA